MDKINGGGPAFPMLGHIVDGEWEPHSQFYGMTLRDYFAAKAIDAAVAKFVFNTECERECAYVDWEHIAESCYDCADAMIKERDAK